MTNKEKVDEAVAKAHIIESKLWSLAISLKYMTAPWSKFIFDNKEQAEAAYLGLSKALVNEKNNYRYNDSDSTFTFESAMGSRTTLDLKEVSAVTLHPPYQYLYNEE